MKTAIQKASNPFYGMKACLKLFSKSSGTIEEKMLDEAYAECDTREKKELFYSLCTLIGDVTNRKHNIFKQNVDNGGSSNRTGFDTVLEWLKKNNKSQFVKFLNAHIFNEYSCWDSLLKSRIQTRKKTKNVVKVNTVLDQKWYRTAICKYMQKVIMGSNPFDKMCIAKFLTLPRLSPRKNHKQMLPETTKSMQYRIDTLKELSDLMGWEYSIKGHQINFKGYREWRKEYNGLFESVLFSTGKIEEFDKTEFMTWLDKLPSNARERVKNRIMYHKVKDADTGEERLRYPEYAIWYEEWLSFKKQAQEQKAQLEEKVRQGIATDEDREKLKEVAKEAKVNFGATNFIELFKQIISGTTEKEKVNSFIDKVKLAMNFLLWCDASGSMFGPAWRMAAFLAAVFMYKNPDDDARNCIGFFSDHPRFNKVLFDKISCKSVGKKPTTWWDQGNMQTVTADEPFIDGSKTFFENYERIDNFFTAMKPSGGTDISSIISGIERIMNSSSVDVLKEYPVWVIVSDGEWNNLSSPEACINDLLHRCEQKIGFRPLVIAVDICGDGSNAEIPERFSGIEGFIYIPSNPSLIETVLCNLDGIQMPDVYAPLESVWKSNRYAPVRAAVI